jgi:hypothetical protein
VVIVAALDTGDQTGSVQDLGRKCGSPPTMNCTPENVAREADRGAQGGVEIEGMKKRQHDATQSHR